MKKNTVTIDGREVAINGERNLLELIRRANIDLPTFCYHSELSVYGACRLCLVNVEGRGICAACSTRAEPGMVVRTSTEEIREIRKIAIELLLANNDHNCPTCNKSSACQLQNLARRLGITEVRFKSRKAPEPVDRSSPSLVRDPNKCVLCGDCVRACSEIQGIGAIDFAHRGHNVAVLPSFGKNLNQVECVNCGLCATVCPTGALTPKSEVEAVWKLLDDPTKTVVAQIAPAVRVALGESFGMAPTSVVTGQIVAALKAIGFDRVFDTSFTADLTVIEEANEFLARKQAGKNIPLFTSCCPGWVKFAEQYYPELLSHISSCRSPQQMFGSLAKEMLPERYGIDRKDLVVVSIMPCTAKKYEAQLPRFEKDGIRDVDHVLTTQELARMIEEAGIRFDQLQPESLDLPMGFKTGAGVIFGNSGGVTEAVLRYAVEKVNHVKLESPDFMIVRGQEGLREATVRLGDEDVKIAIVHGLANARKIAEQVKAGTCEYDFVEVMACPGGCIGGAGQPVPKDVQVRMFRTQGLYAADKMLQLHKPQENHFVTELYETKLGEVGGHAAHRLLHTSYQSRRRIADEDLSLTSSGQAKLTVSVCVGTNCIVRGAQDLLHKLVHHVEGQGLADEVDVRASFCFEQCDRGPTVVIGDEVIHKCTFDRACQALNDALIARSASAM
ncbi:MAG TPA: [FeFe] hydrogenase, group A [Phycisphaerae bacterium]|nr:[FeFe] hydrogenase, group A [Phycisphaerae bacterium]HOJ73723.1 [FeFe] hydrogenase, group A [Phycisphaerae bacterium]HOM50370.1 [FeFe] hydrogenase, group A [Phycisphaerae bacterium]HON66304.1 [FeFe] hydrogenase, group A [Phycisphaerae bacterium]HOQ84218.1 [FeFe] hydrogenase, group A [Phycisphaerae bacterium]